MAASRSSGSRSGSRTRRCEEIAAIRGVPAFRDCAIPAAHTAFTDVDELIEFAERLAHATGLPVGVKSAVGDLGFWERLAGRMTVSGGGPDFVTIDGGEGGTGAAPLAFSDHVALPFKVGLSRVYPIFARAGLAEDVVFVGAGRLGFPDAAQHALALGCDMVNVSRPTTAGSCAGSTQSSSPPARRTTWSPCGPSFCGSAAPVVRHIPRSSTPTASRSSASATAPPRFATSSATSPAGRSSPPAAARRSRR